MDHMKPEQSANRDQGLGSDVGAVETGAAAPASNPAVIVAAVVIFLLVAAAAAAAVYVFVLGTSDDLAPVITPGTTEEAPAPAAAVGDQSEPAPVPLKRVFTFRDVFEPLIKPAPTPPTVTGTVTDETTGTAAVSDGTLTLLDVVAVDGEPAAVLGLNGETYTLKAGEAISGTPWQVLSIDGQTVVLLFGDVQVTLSVGQGVTPATK